MLANGIMPNTPAGGLIKLPSVDMSLSPYTESCSVHNHLLSPGSIKIKMSVLEAAKISNPSSRLSSCPNLLDAGPHSLPSEQLVSVFLLST